MRYLLLGSSLRGMADAATLAADDGHEVLLYDNQRPGIPDGYTGSATVLDPTWRQGHLDDVDAVVTSPWFAEVEGPVADALSAGIAVITEAGFGLAHLDIPYVAITGTNGKTTVTEVTAAMLEASGIRAIAAGNIGRPVSSIRPGDADLLVLELSSYQLRFLPRLVPDAATILNIAPDHLDWHGTYAAYAEAKARIVRDARPTTVFAYDPTDPLVSRVAASATGTMIPCSGTTVPIGGNGVDGETIVVGEARFVPQVVDATYRFDLVVAATLARAVGATAAGVGSIIESFTPGRHRREAVGTVSGVAFVNDSKATNPHAVVAAVGEYDSVVLLAGGRNKGLDLSPIGALPGIRHLVAFGEAAEELAATASMPVSISSGLSDAFTEAVGVAQPGDTVLLSPGCASFDAFTSYEERGDAFCDLVRSLEEAA